MVPVFDWQWPSLILSKKTVQRFLFPCLSLPGGQWCDILGFMPMGSVSGLSTLKISWEESYLWMWGLPCSPVYLLGHFPSLWHDQGSTPTVVDIDHWLISVWASHFTFWCKIHSAVCQLMQITQVGAIYNKTKCAGCTERWKWVVCNNTLIVMEVALLSDICMVFSEVDSAQIMLCSRESNLTVFLCRKSKWSDSWHREHPCAEEWFRDQYSKWGQCFHCDPQFC